MSMQIDSIALEQWVRSSLSEKRYLHSLSVAQTCLDLSKHYSEKLDESLLYECGLLHDIARQWSSDDLTSYAEDHQLKLYEEEKEYPVLLHAPVGASLLSERGFADQLCLAVRYHSLGSVLMGRLGLVLYIADFLEPRRAILDPIKRDVLLESPSLEELCIEVILLEQEYLLSKGKGISSCAGELLKYLKGGGRL